MYILAVVYESQGNHIEAENLLERVASGLEEILGLSDPHTRAVIKHLASVYKKLGRLDDASSIGQRISPSLR